MTMHKPSLKQTVLQLEFLGLGLANSHKEASIPSMHKLKCGMLVSGGV